MGVVTAGGWFGMVKETGQVLVLRKPGTTGEGEAAAKSNRGYNNSHRGKKSSYIIIVIIFTEQ